MKNQAHGMRLDHAIFQGPLPVRIETVEVDTPENYADWPGGAQLPEKLAVWTVQTPSFPEVDPGLVSDPYGVEDSPDAEWISSGINSKGPTAMALGRHANLFLWGFSGEPEQMTESGRSVFVNSICYMAQFDGARPLIADGTQNARDYALLATGYVRRFEEPERTEWMNRVFPERVLASVGRSADELARFYRENLEFLYPLKDRGFDVDDDLEVLGTGNRSPAFLPSLIARWEAAPRDELCARLAARYIDGVAPKSAAQLREWYAANEQRLFFSDRGGFKWFVDTRPDRASAKESSAPRSPEKR